MKKLYVGNLPYSTQEADLVTLFERFGAVEHARVIRERGTNRSKGFGFVDMAESTAATAAIDELDGSDFEGRPLRVSLARDKE